MGFRCIKDPALLGRKGKPEYQKLRGGPSKDPRTLPEIPGKLKMPSTKRKVYSSMPVPKLRYDSKSLGPAPQSYLLIRGFSSLITARHLQTILSSHGTVEVCDLAINDQMVSLGAARVKFAGNPAQAHKIAAKLQTEGIRIDGERAQIQWDESKAKFNAIMYEERERLQREIRHTLEIAKRQKDAEEARSRNQVNDRARKERHIFMKPNSAFTLGDLQALVQLPIEQSHNGYVLFFKSPEELTRAFDRIQALQCNGVSLSSFSKIRNAIDYPSKYMYRTAPSDLPSPANSRPSTASHQPTAQGQLSGPQESMADMMKDLKKALQKDILNKVVLPAIVEALDPKKYEQANTQTFMKRKPEKLGDLRLHFQRKRPKLDDSRSTDSPSDKLASEDVHSEETSQTAPSSVEEQPLEMEKQSEREMVDDLQAEITAELDGENNNFELETAFGTVRAPLPVPIVEQIKEPHLYLSSFERLLIDEQDFLAAKKLLASSHNAIKPQHFEAWTSMYRELEARHRQACTSIEDVDEHMLEPTWTNGFGQSWRSRGYQPIDTAKKIIFLPHRRKVDRPHQVSDALASKGANLKQATREARSSSRRQVRDLSTFETDSLSFNQLLRQSKKVRFAQSSIHNWGLYASEPIGTNEMIIEYVGQVIRSPLADIRERHYCLNGIGSSYLFRVDQDMVIDATKRGNIARLINHSCTPSCIARVIKVGGEKRICIYAARQIHTGDELTYDYRFEREDDEDRIPCLCGTVNCKGYLN